MRGEQWPGSDGRDGGVLGAAAGRGSWEGDSSIQVQRWPRPSAHGSPHSAYSPEAKMNPSVVLLSPSPW